MSSRSQACTPARRAPEWRATLVSASLTTKYAACSTGVAAGRAAGCRRSSGTEERSASSCTAAASPWSTSTLRVDAADGAAQLGQRLFGLAVGVLHGCEPRAIRYVELRPPQRHGEGDQPLLDAVVQVALDPAALGLEGVDQVHARAAQVGDLGRQLRLARVQQHPGQRGLGDRSERHDVRRAHEREPARPARASHASAPGSTCQPSTCHVVDRGQPGASSMTHRDGDQEHQQQEVERPQHDREQERVADLGPRHRQPAAAPAARSRRVRPDGGRSCTSAEPPALQELSTNRAGRQDRARSATENTVRTDQQAGPTSSVTQVGQRPPRPRGAQEARRVAAERGPRVSAMTSRLGAPAADRGSARATPGVAPRASAGAAPGRLP